MRFLPLLAALSSFFPAAALDAKPAPAPAAAVPAPLQWGNVTVSGSLHARMESWDWFQGEANNQYTYLGSILRLSLSQNKKNFDWQLEFALPFVLASPDDAIAAGTQGQLGLGASYFAANSHNANSAMLVAKQGFIRFNLERAVESGVSSPR